MSDENYKTARRISIAAAKRAKSGDCANAKRQILVALDYVNTGSLRGGSKAQRAKAMKSFRAGRNIITKYCGR